MRIVIPHQEMLRAHSSRKMTSMDDNSVVIGKPSETQISSAGGKVGEVVGDKDHAPNNILLIAILLLFAAFFCVLFMPISEEISRQTIVTTIISAITFSLGLLFGKNN